MKIAIVAGLLGVMALSPPCRAANAWAPYANIDPSVDAGNDTGDREVEGLNQAQLDAPGNYPPTPAPRDWVQPPPYGYPPADEPRQAYAPPPGYYPSPAYYPPAGYYPPPPPYGVRMQGFYPY